jgi:hypothetical protein
MMVASPLVSNYSQARVDGNSGQNLFEVRCCLLLLSGAIVERSASFPCQQQSRPDVLHGKTQSLKLHGLSNACMHARVVNLPGACLLDQRSAAHRACPAQ